jgi:hypothetical protein
MSSVFSKGRGRKQMRGTQSAVADKQISAAAGASPTSKGLKRSAASTRAESHRATFRKGPKPESECRFSSQGGCL